jgi:hypothetical protein
MAPVEIRSILLRLTRTFEAAESASLVPSKIRTFWNNVEESLIVASSRQAFARPCRGQQSTGCHSGLHFALQPGTSASKISLGLKYSGVMLDIIREIAPIAIIG